MRIFGIPIFEPNPVKTAKKNSTAVDTATTGYNEAVAEEQRALKEFETQKEGAQKLAAEIGEKKQFLKDDAGEYVVVNKKTGVVVPKVNQKDIRDGIKSGKLEYVQSGEPIVGSKLQAVRDAQKEVQRLADNPNANPAALKTAQENSLKAQKEFIATKKELNAQAHKVNAAKQVHNNHTHNVAESQQTLHSAQKTIGSKLPEPDELPAQKISPKAKVKQKNEALDARKHDLGQTENKIGAAEKRVAAVDTRPNSTRDAAAKNLAAAKTEHAVETATVNATKQAHETALNRAAQHTDPAQRNAAMQEAAQHQVHHVEAQQRQQAAQTKLNQAQKSYNRAAQPIQAAKAAHSAAHDATLHGRHPTKGRPYAPDGAVVVKKYETKKVIGHKPAAASGGVHHTTAAPEAAAKAAKKSKSRIMKTGKKLLRGTGKALTGATTVTKNAIGKGLRFAGWTGLALGGLGALAYFTSGARSSRHADNLPPPPDDLDRVDLQPVSASPELDFSTPDTIERREVAGRPVVGPFTARLAGVNNPLAQPRVVGNDGASLIDGKPLGVLGGPSPN